MKVDSGSLSISGTLHYVTGYEKFGAKPEDQQGNYLALAFASDPWPTALTVGLAGQTAVGISKDSPQVVLQIKDLSKTPYLKVNLTKGEDSRTYNFSLSGLKLEPKASTAAIVGDAIVGEAIVG